MAAKYIVVLAACAVLCAAQPVEKLPVLKEVPAEVLFRNSQPFTLECVTEGGDSVRYYWHKNGQPLALNADITQRKNEGSLVFQKPKNEDAGIYQCFAESEAGTASTRSISVKRAFIDLPKVAPVKTTAVEGRPFKLDCEVPNSYPQPVIDWVRQDEQGNFSPIRIPRILEAPEGPLFFSNITQEDASKTLKYVCTAKTPASDKDVVLAEHYIEEVVPDKNPTNGQLAPVPQYLSKDMTAKVGDVTMIYCIFGGTPLTHPNWFKDGKDVNGEPGDRVTRRNRSAGRRLLIKNTLLEDQGTYTCDGDNGVGKQTHSIRLTVVSAPEFVEEPQYAEKLQKRRIAKEGQDVKIACQVRGIPPPKLTWTYNAKPLTTNDRISIQSNQAPVFSVADLTIKNVQKTDKGYYGCTAVNENGEAYYETLLNVV